MKRIENATIIPHIPYTTVEGVTDLIGHRLIARRLVQYVRNRSPGYLALWRRRRFEEIPAKSDEVQLASGVTSVNLHEVEDVVLCSLENGDVLIYAMRSDAQKTRLEQTKVLKLSSPVVCMQVLSGEDGTLLMTGKDGVFSLDRHLSEVRLSRTLTPLR